MSVFHVGMKDSCFRGVCRTQPHAHRIGLSIFLPPQIIYHFALAPYLPDHIYFAKYKITTSKVLHEGAYSHYFSERKIRALSNVRLF